MIPVKKYQPDDPVLLPQEEYTPVFIKYFEGYTCLEIATALHLPIQTVRERLRKSKRKLSISFKLFKRSFRCSINQKP